MENYTKGKNVEDSLKKENISIPMLPEDFLWMHVKGGSKIRNLLTFALKEFPEKRAVVWTGFGQPIGKTITCAEIMKREFRNTLHQITKICYRLYSSSDVSEYKSFKSLCSRVEEHWDPLIPELDPIVVKRKLPMIHILLAFDPLDREELGYQAPGLQLQYSSNEKKYNRNGNNKRWPKQQYSKRPTKQLAGKGKNTVISNKPEDATGS